MIRIDIFRNVFDTSDRESLIVPAAEPMLIADLLPDDIGLDDPTLVLSVDGVPVEGGEVKPGQQLVVVHRPAFTVALLWQVLWSVVMLAASYLLTSSMMDDDPPVVSSIARHTPADEAKPAPPPGQKGEAKGGKLGKLFAKRARGRRGKRARPQPVRVSIPPTASQ